MEKQADAKSKSNSERSARRRQRPQEPPKFYSKNYLRRYNHGEVRTSTTNFLTAKKNSATDQTTATTTAAAGPTRSQQNEEQNNNGAVIAISPTILKLADAGETLVEISKNENPYNRARSNSRPANQQLSDYRYSLLNAMSSVKSSYFKCDVLSSSEEQAPNEPSSPSTHEDELARHDTFKKVKAKVEEAIKRHKVFLIRGELPRLKEALEERGWVQKYEPSRTRSLPYATAANVNLESVKSLGDMRLADGTLNERALTYALLRHTQPDFIWDCRNDFAEWDRSIASSVLLNRFHKPSLYTSKLGMAQVLQEAHWIHEASVADVLFPRSYNPSRELAAFVTDFRRCAAVALLRRFVRRVTNTETNYPDADELQQEPTDGGGGGGGGESEVPLEQIEFAVRCCEEQIAELEHEDIDAEVDSEISEEEWLLFTGDCERLLYKPNGMANLPKTDPDRLEALHAAAQSALAKLSKLDSQFELNGEKNIWIVKPSNLCCGSGIFMTHELKTIMQRVDSKPRDYYLVQKYIERPLLVHATKFDIRQWFLVTSTFPMTIWTFKEALLRLSSKPYTSATYHEAIHLCNTAVQERYDLERRRKRSRGEELPSDQPSVRDQGWNCEKLNEYLKSLGHEGEPYYERIYPAMSRAIVLTMLAAQDFMDRRRCSFELYGADFMVMDDLSVWLIEINTNPRMHPPSSRITHRLYAAVLDSLVKVVLDLPLNPHADTGGFELAYRQPIPDTQPYLGPCLFAFGKAMTLHEPPTNYVKKHCTWIGVNGKQCRAVTAPPVIKRQSKVVDFIAYLNSTSSTCKEELEDEARALN